jgi:type II secretory pathway predicted ATPase ExeA
MYLDFFGLRQLPFRQRPDPLFLHLDAAYSAARAELAQALQRQDAITIFSGEAGVGKTTLLESALAEQATPRPLIRINQPDVSAEELMQAIAYQLSPDAGGETRSYDGSSYDGGSYDGASYDGDSCDIEQMLAALPAGTPRPLLIVDHTHRFPPPTLRTLLQLTLRSDRLAVLLIGRANGTSAPSWAAAGGLRANTNPVVLLPMNAERVGSYIEARLRAAGGNDRSPFTPDAHGVTFHRTRGIPRLINALCDIALSLACARSLERVGASEIRAAAQDVRWLELYAREHGPAIVAAPGTDTTSAVACKVDRLLVLRQGICVTELPLLPGRMRIGRLPDNDVVLDSQFVSRYHCELITVADGPETNTTVVDAGSHNGTLVNRRRVHRRWLLHGDEVRIGDYVLRYVGAVAEEMAGNDAIAGRGLQ